MRLIFGGIWFRICILTLTLRIVLSYLPEITEKWYSEGFYRLPRFVFDYTSLCFDWPWLILIIFLLALLLLYSLVFRRNLRFFKMKSWIEFFSAAIALFLILWGFHYARIPIEKKLKITATEPSSQDIEKEMEKVYLACINIRQEIKGDDSAAISDESLPESWQPSLRRDMKSMLREMGYQGFGEVHVKEMYPAGFLYLFQSAGVYLPFTGEGHIESGLHLLQKPFTMAHEMAHGYGFGDEATCNFLAFMVGKIHRDPLFRYAIHFNYLRILSYELEERQRKLFMDRLQPGIKNDWKSIIEKKNKFWQGFSGFQHITYEAYLRLQGVQDGMQSYQRMIDQVLAYQKKNGSFY
jgi:hypothetical protein